MTVGMPTPQSISSHLLDVTPESLVSFHFLDQSPLPQAESHLAAMNLMFKGCCCILFLVFHSFVVPPEKDSEKDRSHWSNCRNNSNRFRDDQTMKYLCTQDFSIWFQQLFNSLSEMQSCNPEKQKDPELLLGHSQSTQLSPFLLLCLL